MSNCGHTQIYVSGPIGSLEGLRAAAAATREPAERGRRKRFEFDVQRLTGTGRVVRYAAYTDLGRVESTPGRLPTLAMAVGAAHDIAAFDFVLDLSASYPDLTFDAGFQPENDFTDVETILVRGGEIIHNAIYRDGFQFRENLGSRGGCYYIIHLHERSKRGGNDEQWMHDALDTVANRAEVAPGWHRVNYEGASLLWHPVANGYGTLVTLTGATPTIYRDVDQYGGYETNSVVGYDECVAAFPELADILDQDRMSRDGPEQSVEASRIGHDYSVAVTQDADDMIIAF